MSIRIYTTYFLAISAVVLAMPAAQAEVTAKDVQVMARALGFTEKPPTGEVNMAIVYAPGNPESAKEANDLQALLGSGLKAGNLTLKPVLVKLDDVAGVGDVAAFLLTEGTGADGAKVAAAAKAKQKPCLTVDLAQVQSGACAMGIKSEPKVEIVVNKAAAEADGISFGAAFRMMITEL